MQPADFAQAARALAQGAGGVQVPGLAQPLGPPDAALARLAGLCDRLFLVRPPGAAGAVLCAASHSPAPGQRAHAAGLGPDGRSAWTRALGEVAEARALVRAADDSRLQAGQLPLLDADLAPAGTIPADLVLRAAGDRATVHGVAAGADLAQAARAAWSEAVERHAVALWLAGAAPARPLDPPASLRRFEAALRGGAVAAPLRFLRLPGAVPGLAVVVALSDAGPGPVAGYGCAPDPVAAACKAATEVVQGEFALYLETQALPAGAAPVAPDGFAARAARLAARPDLTRPVAGALEPGPTVRPCFAVLTRPQDGVPVLRVVAPGLMHPPAGMV
ncbi:MAG: YcaO-like family protein [Gemmobacter sp.]|uniref:YcaO-like family protein n=1 Tax=Gemmobacter sp. TaxID=1898957 RepID=UPI00391CC00D